MVNRWNRTISMCLSSVTPISSKNANKYKFISKYSILSRYRWRALCWVADCFWTMKVPDSTHMLAHQPLHWKTALIKKFSGIKKRGFCATFSFNVDQTQNSASCLYQSVTVQFERNKKKSSVFFAQEHPTVYIMDTNTSIGLLGKVWGAFFNFYSIEFYILGPLTGLPLPPL